MDFPWSCLMIILGLGFVFFVAILLQPWTVRIRKTQPSNLQINGSPWPLNMHSPISFRSVFPVELQSFHDKNPWYDMADDMCNPLVWVRLENDYIVQVVEKQPIYFVKLVGCHCPFLGQHWEAPPSLGNRLTGRINKWFATPIYGKTMEGEEPQLGDLR